MKHPALWLSVALSTTACTPSPHVPDEVTPEPGAASPSVASSAAPAPLAPTSATVLAPVAALPSASVSSPEPATAAPRASASSGSPATKGCSCFDWVHLDAFGKTCFATVAECKKQNAKLGSWGARTECRPLRAPHCGNEAARASR